MLLPLEEVVNELGPSLQTMGSKMCLFPNLRKAKNKRRMVIKQTSGGERWAGWGQQRSAP